MSILQLNSKLQVDTWIDRLWLNGSNQQDHCVFVYTKLTQIIDKLKFLKW